MKALKLGLVVSLFALFCVACGTQESTNSNTAPAANKNTAAATPAPATPNANATGASKVATTVDAAALFSNDSAPKCASCHEADGKGKKAISKDMPDFTDAAWQKKATDAEMTETIKNGHKPMPPYKDKLSDDQIKALVAYVRKFAK
jgi:mono/diheme cytochrome c family protein